MALVTLLTQDPKVRSMVRSTLAEPYTVALTRSWERLSWLVRERPTTVAILDSGGLPSGLREDLAVGELRRRYPSLGLIFIVRSGADPVSLFRLGRAGLGSLALLRLDELSGDLGRAVGKASARGVGSMVVRAVSPLVPSRELTTVRMALHAVQRGWSTEVVAARLGLTRPHLSVRLKAAGLPSMGHLLIWAKLLHAGRWLMDPGRSAESVSRQLEYSSGAAFRRALRAYAGCTPTGLKQAGGFRHVLAEFLDACGLGDSVVFDRSVA